MVQGRRRKVAMTSRAACDDRGTRRPTDANTCALLRTCDIGASLRQPSTTGRARPRFFFFFWPCLFLLLLNCYFSVIGPCWLPASKGSFPRLFANQKRNETGGHDRPNGSALLGTSLTGGSNLAVAVVYSNDLADSRWPTAALDRYHGAGQSGRRRRR